MNNGAARHTPGSGRSNPILAKSHRLARASAWGTSYRRGRHEARTVTPSPSAAAFAPEHTALILPFPASSAPTSD
jgi:hypothetical protein